MMGVININRVNRTAISINSGLEPLSSPSPGATKGTNQGAQIKLEIDKNSVTRNKRFNTDEAIRQACFSPSSFHTLVKTGISAAESVAPAMSWKRLSGIRNATK